ncbi:MAG: alpha/beta hydrolase [Bacteroidota bacterium]
MNRIFTLLLLAAGPMVFGQGGALKESLSLTSAVLGKEVEYSLWLPPDYDQSSRRYPVLYLLHGYSDDETGWTQFGEVKAIADRQLSKEEMTAMIIVMPDAGVTWYINSSDGKVNYEDFFVKEFIPHIDKTLRTRTDRQYRAVAGLSMGGMGTCVMAMKHPELFSAAAPLSAAVWTDDEIISVPEENWTRGLGLVFGKDLKGKDRLTPHYRKNAAIAIVNSANPDELKKVRFYIDCGDKDFLIKGNMALHAAMIDRKIPHEFRVREGVHDWTYWRTALPEVFKFISTSFHR